MFKGRHTFIHLFLLALSYQIQVDGSETPVLKSYRALDPCNEDQRLTIGVDIGEVERADSLYLIEFALKYDPGVVQYNILLENAGLTKLFEEKFVNVFEEDSLIVGNIGTFSTIPRSGNDVLFAISFNYIGDGSQKPIFKLEDLYLGFEYRGWISDTMEFEDLEIIPEINDQSDRELDVLFEKDSIMYQEKGEKLLEMDLDFGTFKKVSSGTITIDYNQSEIKVLEAVSINETFEITNNELTENEIQFSFRRVGSNDQETDLALRLNVEDLTGDTLDLNISSIELNEGACITKIEGDSFQILTEDKTVSIIETDKIEILNIEVYDTLGNLLKIENDYLNLKYELSGGLYLLRLNYKDGSQIIEKLIID